MFEKLKNEILEILKKSPIENDPVHAQLVHKWVLKLKPDADEALEISALAHDIDRAITGITEKDLTDYSKIDDFKKEHAKRSAQFISEILRNHNYSEDVIIKVVKLVENHEVGGDPETNILRNADSISYFEGNIPIYLKRNGRDRTKGKIKFMYKRIPEDIKTLVDGLSFKDKEVEALIQEAISEIN
jgi:hypothetical protein